MALVLGITGGIGSGKSFVSRIFASLGCQVYDSDSRTKQLYDQDHGLLYALVEILGDGILKREGKGFCLDRQAMASIIFSDKVLMQRVKDVVYPFVMEDFCKWKRWKRGVVVFESAVILENDYVHSFMDKTLVVTAPLELRIQRVMKRDNSTLEQVRRRLENQCSDQERIRKADFVTEASGNTDLESAAKKILERMKA